MASISASSVHDLWGDTLKFYGEIAQSGGTTPMLGDSLIFELQPHEPSPGADPGDASLPRTRGRRSEGRELGKRDSDAH